MADLVRHATAERDIDQAITALKKGAYLLKYGRRGRPKFCPFRLSPDESSLIWYYGKQEKKIELRNVTMILPGQRTITSAYGSSKYRHYNSQSYTRVSNNDEDIRLRKKDLMAIFHRYPRPEKDYQSFSLLYDDRSLDLICKDKDEAEVWFAGLKALISRGSYHKIKYEARSDGVTSDSSSSHRPSVSVSSADLAGVSRNENIGQSRLGKAFADIISYTATNKNYNRPDTAAHYLSSASLLLEEDVAGRGSTTEALRVSVSSAVSSSSHNSFHEDFDVLGDCFIWGEGTANGVLGGGEQRMNYSSGPKVDSYLPKPLESSTILNVRSMAGRSRHALLVTKHGEVYSWGEESRGRLGHGVAADVSHPKVIQTLTGKNIEIVECGEFHSCAITRSGDLYTWGDGTISCGLLGHGSKVSHWIPRKVGGPLQGLPISYVSCGPWHTALITSGGQLFTFGDGTFGALGHGDHCGVETPREVEALKGLRSLRVACGAWHTAAVVVVATDGFEDGSSEGTTSGKLFTWGDGDKGRLGHVDNKSRSVPENIASLEDIEFTKVACGCDVTVALTSSGCIYTMGSNAHGQLGRPSTGSMTPLCIEDPLAECYVLEIACGSHHVAVLTSKSYVYTWGKGTNGQLGHGDYDDRKIPTLVESLKDKQVKSITCGSNFTAIICLHKSVSADENSVCSGCQNVFSFRRKKHNCYNCGLVFCHACSSKRSLKASLAPSMSRPYRVCDDCFSKLQMAVDSVSSSQIPKTRNGSVIISRDSAEECSGPPHPRLSSSDSFKHEGRISKPILRTEINDMPVSPREDGNAMRGGFPSHISPTVQSGNFLAISVPPISVLRTTSPLPCKRSPTESGMTMFSLPGSSADAITDLTAPMYNMTQDEFKWLKARVEILANKSHNLEAELEKKSFQLKEAKTLVKSEAEEKQAAMEVIKSLTEQLEEMANRVSEQKTTKSYSQCYSEHVNDPDNLLSSRYIVDNGETSIDSNNQLCKHITKGDADLDAEKGLNDLNHKGKQANVDTDINVEQKLNGLKHKTSKHIDNDYSDLNGELNWKSLQYKPHKNSEQKGNSLKNNPGKHTTGDNSVRNDVHKFSGLKYNPEKHIVDENLYLSAEQRWNGRNHKHGNNIVDGYSDHTAEQMSNSLKHKSGKHIADDYSDLNVEQKWEGLNHKPKRHTTDDNSDFSGEQKRSGLRHKPDKNRTNDNSDFSVEHKQSGLKHKPGKHIVDDNSGLNVELKRIGHKHKSRKHISNDDLDLNGDQKWNGRKHKSGKHIVDGNSELNVESKRIGIKHKSRKHKSDDDLDIHVEQQWKGIEHKPRKHITDYNSDPNVEKKRIGLKHKSRKHISDDDSDLNAEQQWNGLKHKPEKHIADDSSDLIVEKRRIGHNPIFRKPISDDDSYLTAEQQWDGLKHKPGKHIADANSDLNVEKKWIGLKHNFRKHMSDDGSDHNVEQQWNGCRFKPANHIADDYSDHHAAKKRNGQHKSGKHIVDDFLYVGAKQNWNPPKHNPGKHVVVNNSDLNVEQKLNLDYNPDEQSEVTCEATSKHEPTDSSTIPALFNREKEETHKQERMIQEEPGVYITLCELPKGGNELKRVRFSRKRFTEQQADKWWKENLIKVRKRHDIRIL